MTYLVITRNLALMTRSENPFVRLAPAGQLPVTSPFKPTSVASDPSPPAGSEALAPVVELVTSTSLEHERDLRIAALADEARSVKKYLESVQARYDDLRGQLWDLVGHRAGKNVAGGFNFRAPAARRKTDLKLLERRWPEVYSAVVSVTDPEDDAVGSLYL